MIVEVELPTRSSRKYCFSTRVLTVIFTLILLCIKDGLAQSPSGKWYPKVGEPFPDHVFTELINYPTREAKISDFRGKWLMLDVWGRYCSGCLASFPKLNKLNRNMNDRVQLIMVGTIAAADEQAVKTLEIETKRVYTRLEKEYNLDFTVAYDATFYDKYDISGLPAYFIIDPQGILRAKTFSVDEESLASLIEGKAADFKYHESRSEAKSKTYTRNFPLLTEGRKANGGIDTSFFFRSMLLDYHLDGPLPGRWRLDLSNPKSQFAEQGRLDLTGFFFEDLCRLAYWGESSWDTYSKKYYETRFLPVLYENFDSANYSQKQYTYSLTIPQNLATRDRIMNAIRSDLENYFGVVGCIQKRAVPVYYLEIADPNLIQFRREKNVASSISEQPSGPFNGFLMKGMDMFRIIGILKGKTPIKIPLLDLTGIDCPIDLDLQANLLDMESVREGLKKAGFKLVYGTKEFDCLVVSKAPDH